MMVIPEIDQCSVRQIGRHRKLQAEVGQTELQNVYRRIIAET